LYKKIFTKKFDPLQMVGQNRGCSGFNLSFLFSEDALLEDYKGQLERFLVEERDLIDQNFNV